MRGNLASYLLLLSESLSPWGSFLLRFFLPSPLVRSLLALFEKIYRLQMLLRPFPWTKFCECWHASIASAPLPPVLVPLAIAAMHTVGQGVVVARHRQAHLCLHLLTHCCLIFVQLPARGTFHFSQVANQARAAASLQQGLIMAEVEFSSPLRRDNAQ